MSLETASFISQLVATNPVGGVDAYSTADDHLRLLKAVLQSQFPNLGAAAVTSTAAELNKLSGVTALPADLNILSGAAAGGLTAAEILYVANVTSDIQTQLNAKLSTANDAVGNANLANMAQATVKGRASGAGTGDPVDLTAAQLLAIILTVDGSGSGLDADTLDGSDSSAFAAAAHNHSATEITSGSLSLARGGTAGTDAATARTALGVTATGADTTYNARASNLSDVANAATARSNLGLGSAAVQASSAFLQPGNNLSDVGAVATARTNLGLGALAVLASINNGNWSGTALAAGNGGTGVTSILAAMRLFTLAWTIQSDPGGTPAGTAGDVFAYY